MLDLEGVTEVSKLLRLEARPIVRDDSLCQSEFSSLCTYMFKCLLRFTCANALQLKVTLLTEVFYLHVIFKCLLLFFFFFQVKSYIT